MKKKYTYPSPLPKFLGYSFFIRKFSRLYERIVQYRNNYYSDHPEKVYRSSHKVISIGGIRAGGTGKTPLSLMVALYLQDIGYEVAFLSRGFKRKSKEIVLVAPNEQAVLHDVGDEPLLMHETMPNSWLGIGPNRSKSAMLIEPKLSSRAAFILDDGFQHRAMGRDLDIVSIHERILHDELIPAGYLREPICALNRAHIIVLIGEFGTNNSDLEQLASTIRTLFPEKLVVAAKQTPLEWVNGHTGETASTPPVKAPYLFCGIARPERFKALVDTYGIILSGEFYFKDHHAYSIKEIERKHDLYSKGIITTEKDFFRLKPLNFVIGPNFWYLKIGLQFLQSTEEQRFKETVIKNLE